MYKRRQKPGPAQRGKQDEDHRHPEQAEGLASGIKLAEPTSVTDLDNSVSIPETVPKNGIDSLILREL